MVDSEARMTEIYIHYVDAISCHYLWNIEEFFFQCLLKTTNTTTKNITQINRMIHTQTWIGHKNRGWLHEVVNQATWIIY